MSEALFHEPEGDRNPYDAVTWSRHPLEPHADETFRVGVRASREPEKVVVEWQADGETGELELSRDGDVWAGDLGPFSDECRYRFTSTGASMAEDRTDWFSVAITSWEPISFRGIDSDGEHVHVGADGATLTLTPGSADSLAWSLSVASRDPGVAVSASCGAWSAQLDDHGVVLARGGQRLRLGADVAHTGGQLSAWRLRWSLDPDERILGTGERYDALDQRGRRPDVRVYEQYKGQGSRTYFPVPWLMSTRGYGLAIDGAARIQFDLGATRNDEASVTVPSSQASGRWYSGSPEQLLQAWAGDLGSRPSMPLWAFGPWMSGNEWDSDRRVREVVDRTAAEGIPATTLVIEAWADEATFYLFNDTEHDPVPGSDPVPTRAMKHGGRWPDPKTLVDWLHERDIRVVLWQIPVLKDMTGHEQHRQDAAYAEEAGLCVGTLSGESYRNRGWWFPGSRVIDFTNPAASEWWFAKRAYLLDDIGIDGFKTDGGEHLWGRDVVTAGGATGDAAANEYPTRYLSAYHDFMREHGHDRPVTFSRAGFTGSQGLPAHWAGDEDSTWEAYRASLTAGLTASSSGVVFWGWDIAGFSGKLPSAELYKRATAMAAFCPIMQYHSEHNEHRQPLADRTPWNIADHHGDADVSTIYRFYARLRMNLIPYLFGLGEEATRTGLPMMRAMAIEFPDDPQAAAIEDQFLLGRDLLVAPVLEPGAEERQVYLPEGEWWDLWSGSPATSGWHMAPAPLDTVPVFVRSGACIPLWMPEIAELGAMVGLPAAGNGRLVLMVGPGSCRNRLADPLNHRVWTIDVERAGDTLTVSATDAPQDATLWLRGDGLDRQVPLPGGDSTLRIDLGST